MAAADYRSCDVCGAKSFYDSVLDYDFHKYPDTGLFNLGNWMCLCRECSKTHEIAILRKASEK